MPPPAPKPDLPPPSSALAQFLSELDGPLPMEELFDRLPNVVFFIKDRTGRYVAVNQTLVERCGAPGKAEVIGRLPREVFPAALAARYEQQDEVVLREGRMVDQLELHYYPKRQPGWCLTTKRVLRRRHDGKPWGLIGISRDVQEPGRKSPEYRELAATITFIHENFAEVLRVEDLALRAKLSVSQFDQRIRRLFHLSPIQLIQKLRVDEATRRLTQTDASLAEIAAAVGYCDQSALTRQFRAMVGVTPGQFRRNR